MPCRSCDPCHTIIQHTASIRQEIAEVACAIVEYIRILGLVMLIAAESIIMVTCPWTVECTSIQHTIEAIDYDLPPRLQASDVEIVTYFRHPPFPIDTLPLLTSIMDAAVSLGDPSKALDLANIRFQLMYSHFVPSGRIFPAPL